VVKALADALIWHSEKTDNEEWYGADMEDQLPADFYKMEDWLRVMEGEEAEEIIWRALTQNLVPMEVNLTHYDKRNCMKKKRSVRKPESPAQPGVPINGYVNSEERPEVR